MPRCEGCGFRFRGGRRDRYCSQICEGGAAMAWVVAGLRRYAEEHPAKVG